MSAKGAEKCEVQVMADEREYSEGGTRREVIRGVSCSWCRHSGGRERGDGSKMGAEIKGVSPMTWPSSLAHASDCAKSTVELVKKHDSSIIENVDSNLDIRKL